MNSMVYLNGQYLPPNEAFISPNDRGFLFSDGVYEVIRCYDGYLFQMEAHLQRLQYGLQELRIKFTDTLQLTEIANQLMEKNDLGMGEALIYIQITRGVAPRTHYFPPETTAPTVYITATRFKHPPNEREHGVKSILVPDNRWTRCDIKSVGLLANVLARQQARENNAVEAIFVRDGVALEGTHCNLCAIFDGTLVTVPKSNYILPGITRSVVFELCEELGIPVKENPIFIEKLKSADELMIVGTTVEITPVIQVDDWSVADGKPGILSQKLRRVFREKILNP